MGSLEQLKMHSSNLVDANIEKIASLFPNCITEAQDEHGNFKKAIDFDLLRQELSHVVVEGDQERYRLDWPGKKEAILTANAPIAKTLRPCREESVNFDSTQNLFIEGDNLDALKLLQENYLDKVKMIYIDPPYNTGKDFIYEDDFAENTNIFLERTNQIDGEGNKLVSNKEVNGRYHSDWLSMIYSRLKLARNLLSEDGVIFISIDENEVYNLIKICDEIFGSTNHLENFHLQVRYANKSLNEDSDFQRIMEYVLIYAKDKNIFKPKKPSEPYDLSKFCFSIKELTCGQQVQIANKKLTIFKDGEWEITKHSVGEVGLLKETWASGSLVKQGGSAAEFLAKYLIDRKSEDGLGVLYKIDNMGEDGLGYRYVSGPQKADAIRGKFYSGVPLERIEEIKKGDALKYKPIINFYDYSGDFGNIRNEGGVAFNGGKKPIKMLQQFLEMASLKKSDLVLDFFAGSGSTAHALMDFNKKNKLNLNFILVQLPAEIETSEDMAKAGYKNIAEISKERIRRSGAKILEENESLEGIENLDIGFRVLKVDLSNMKDVYYTPDSLKKANLDFFESNIKEDRSDEDLLFQVMLDWGLELSLPIEPKQILDKTVYFVAENSLVACFQPLSMELIDQIAQQKPLRFVSAERAIVNDHDKTNIRERFKQLSPETDVKFL